MLKRIRYHTTPTHTHIAQKQFQVISAQPHTHIFSHPHPPQHKAYFQVISVQPHFGAEQAAQRISIFEQKFCLGM